MKVFQRPELRSVLIQQNVKQASIIIAHDPERGDELLQRCLNSVNSSIRLCDPRLNAEIIVTEEPSKVHSRNEAAKKALGDILVFIDDDAIATDYWLHELLKPFSDKEVAVVGGPTLLMPSSDLKEQLADRILTTGIACFRSTARHYPKGELRESDESELTSCNMAVRKDVFMSAGGFPDIIPCEENALIVNIQKLGFKIIYNPLAIVHHNRAKLFMPYAKKIFYYGRGRGRFMRRYGKAGRPKLLGMNFKSSVIFFSGLIIHYVSYISGLIYGWLKG